MADKNEPIEYLEISGFQRGIPTAFIYDDAFGLFRTELMGIAEYSHDFDRIAILPQMYIYRPGALFATECEITPDGNLIMQEPGSKLHRKGYCLGIVDSQGYDNGICFCGKGKSMIYVSAVWNWSEGRFEEYPYEVSISEKNLGVDYHWFSYSGTVAELEAALGLDDCRFESLIHHFTATSEVTAENVDVYEIKLSGNKDWHGRKIEVIEKTDRKGSVTYTKRLINYTAVNDMVQRFVDQNYLGSAKKSAETDANDTEESEQPEQLFAGAKRYAPQLQTFAKKMNTGDYSVDPAVLEQVVKEITPWYNEYQRKINASEPSDAADGSERKPRCLPNLVFLGEPGTGKTEFAQRFAENVLNAVFVPITGSGLKAGYIGQTGALIADRLNALVDGKPRMQPKILFVDEAYVLLNSQKSEKGDNFSKEAVEVLLKATENKPDRTVSAPKLKDEDTTFTVSLDENTAIWMAGYEKEMRKGLSENKGFFRRVKCIELPIPSVDDQLFPNFKKRMEDGSDIVPEDVWSKSRDCILANAEMIKDYFRWAKSRTYSEFFGNYAGVNKLIADIEKSCIYNERPINDAELKKIIDANRSELRMQYKTVTEKGTDRIPFMVYTDVTEKFDDYKGADSAKEKLGSVIDIISDPDSYDRCENPRGALLVGPPGTGKTFLARCMAGELTRRIRKKSINKDVAFIKAAATELTSSELVKALFAESGSYDNVVIFIDEIDAIGGKRGKLSDRSVLIQLMNELDGFDGNNNVFVLAATNDPESLDNALKRPGRFDITLEIGYPGSAARRALVREYTKKMDEYSDALRERLAEMLRGCSQVEMKAILNEARILYLDCERKLPELTAESELKSWFAHRAVNRGISGTRKIKLKNGAVSVSDSGFNEGLFECDVAEVIARRTIGERSVFCVEKEFSLEENDNNLSSVAIHEVGHAFVSVLHGMKFEKITILARGNILGYVKPAAHIVTKRQYLYDLDISLAGRAAEEVIYGADNVSHGARSDIRMASESARRMVMELGMSDNIGMTALTRSGSGYLGTEKEKLASEGLMNKADEEVCRLLSERYTRTLELLKDHEETLVVLAREVFTAEEMGCEDFVRRCRELGVSGTDFDKLCLKLGINKA